AQVQVGGRGGGAGGAAGGAQGGAGGTVSPTRQYQNTTMVGDAIITSDSDTRRLIVVTDDLTAENIGMIIASLDKPKPQVLINVVFLQVTHDNDLDLGTEASYTQRVSVGANSIDGTGTATSKFGIAAALADPTSYGLFYQLLGRDVNATIHALASTNKTEILSRPSVLTRSNQQATIVVGQRVPIITGSQVAQQTGQVTNTVEIQDVGIILRVTPFITSDGLVEMILRPEISSISATTVPISENVRVPVIDTRSADTVVVTRSDKTIVIGGLMSNTKNDTDNKVPILGDIPLLGNLFKRKINKHSKTELLIFLTPHVIPTPDDLDRITDAERGRLNLAPQAFDKAEIGKFLPPPKS
ncbi:MAG: hypothetical protein ABIZ49_07305, partial [Opitutaceae bacterium]